MTISKDDFGTLAICSIRHCHGKMSYMPDLVRDIVRPHLQELSDKDLTVMLEDCKFQKRANLYGDPIIDKPDWLKWEEELKQEKKRRGEQDG